MGVAWRRPLTIFFLIIRSSVIFGIWFQNS